MNKKREKQIDRIENKNDALTIKQIEKLTDTALKKSTENRKEFIENLFYLQKTQRFKENKRYKNASFETYIKDRFRLSSSAYMEERVAFTLFLPEIEKHGLEPIIKIRNRCGTDKVKDVSEALSNAKEKSKTGITLEKEAKIIKGFWKPKKESVPEKPQTMALAELRGMYNEKCDLVKAQAKYIDELEERIKRLVKALEAERALNIMRPFTANEQAKPQQQPSA